MGITELKPLYCFHFTATVSTDNLSRLIYAPPFAKNCPKFKRSHLSKAFYWNVTKHGEKRKIKANGAMSIG
jgi:hypothetical protein